MYPYLVFLLLFFALPVLLMAWPLRRGIVRYWRTGLWLLAFIYTAGWFWDWLSWRTGLWRYDSAPALGWWISGLPVEEFVGFYVFGTALIYLVVLAILRRTRHV